MSFVKVPKKYKNFKHGNGSFNILGVVHFTGPRSQQSRQHLIIKVKRLSITVLPFPRTLIAAGGGRAVRLVRAHPDEKSITPHPFSLSLSRPSSNARPGGTVQKAEAI